MISNASLDGFTANGGVLARLTRESGTIKTRLDTLNIQSSSGLVSQTFGGLGSGAQLTLDLRPQMARIDSFTQNIGVAATMLSVTDATLGEIGRIAQNFLNGTMQMSADTPQGVDTWASQAKAALGQVQSLLNTQVGQTYIFAGEDTSNPPVPDTSFQAYVLSLQTPIAGLAVNGGTATAAATLAAASATSPYATSIGSAPQTVQVGFNETASTGVVAGQNASATSQGTSTTGSYANDLIRALSTISAMSSSQTSIGQSFTDLVADTRISLQSVVNAIASEQGGIGIQQQILTQSQSTLASTQTALTTQVSNVENVDAAAAATALTQAQQQLQISYKLISSMQSLSLVNFL
jgi:flagellar hook-associated protein 3 FlgL